MFPCLHLINEAPKFLIERGSGFERETNFAYCVSTQGKPQSCDTFFPAFITVISVDRTMIIYQLNRVYICIFNMGVLWLQHVQMKLNSKYTILKSSLLFTYSQHLPIIIMVKLENYTFASRS